MNIHILLHFLFHCWGKWELYTTNRPGGGMNEFRQRRTCQICGYTEE